MSSIKRTPTNAQSEAQFSTHEQNQPVACRHGMDTELGLLNHLAFPKWMPIWWWYGRSIVKFRHMVLIPPPRAVRRVLLLLSRRQHRLRFSGRSFGQANSQKWEWWMVVSHDPTPMTGLWQASLHKNHAMLMARVL